MYRPYFNWMDAQQGALSFLVQQLTIIEPEIYRIRYPDIQYPALIPVDTTGNEWAKSITFFSIDHVGRAQWFHHTANDVPVADITRDKFEQGIEMAAIGYRYTLEELGQAMSTPGLNLTSERGAAAKRAYDEFVDDIALRGDTTKNMIGLINQTSPFITVVNAPADGTASSPYWTAKTNVQIMRDFNSLLTGMYTASLTIDIADTVLMPISVITSLSEMQMPNLPITVLDWIQTHNLYTFLTKQPLDIRAVRGLEVAGDSNTGRIVAYRKDPQVLKIHIPMPHRFLPIWQRGPMTFDIPGVFRLGGLEIRRPTAFRYLDHVSATPS